IVFDFLTIIEGGITVKEFIDSLKIIGLLYVGSICLILIITYFGRGQKLILSESWVNFGKRYIGPFEGEFDNSFTKHIYHEQDLILSWDQILEFKITKSYHTEKIERGEISATDKIVESMGQRHDSIYEACFIVMKTMGDENYAMQTSNLLGARFVVLLRELNHSELLKELPY
ncbi:MAG: hypothetical protein AAB453_03255, partial [Patescibacteria group bacterium]